MNDAEGTSPAQGFIALTENISAPEVFAAEANSFSILPGVVTITFVSYRFDNSVVPPQQKKVVIGRLIMPTAGAEGLAIGLYDFLKSRGLLTASAPTDPKEVQ